MSSTDQADATLTKTWVYFATSVIICCALFVDSLLAYFCKLLCEGYFAEKHSLTARLTTLSMTASAIYVSYTAGLYSYQSYSLAENTQYPKALCLSESLSIIFFMIAKLSMYCYFIIRVDASFQGSAYAIPRKILFPMIATFLTIMTTIGGFYIYYIARDFTRGDGAEDALDCHNSKVSGATTTVIWTGAAFDSLWCIICWLMFVNQLVKLINAQEVTSRIRGSSALERAASDSAIDAVSRRASLAEKRKSLLPFLGLIYRLTVLSFWCAFSTLVLGLSTWHLFPTLCGVLNTTVNAVCLFLGFKFALPLFESLCVCCSISKLHICLTPWVGYIDVNKLQEMINEERKLSRKSTQYGAAAPASPAPTAKSVEMSDHASTQASFGTSSGSDAKPTSVLLR
jgi:hypothetical protein